MALGTHLIVECYVDDKTELLKDPVRLETLLKDAASSAGATILYSYFHKFDQGEGVTGFVALAESHLSVHTWPEFNYMALDVFMCGKCNPQVSVDYIGKQIEIPKIEIRRIMRGADFENITYD
jgi:S-adenosylmethionine decarboxylase